MASGTTGHLLCFVCAPFPSSAPLVLMVALHTSTPLIGRGVGLALTSFDISSPVHFRGSLWSLPSEQKSSLRQSHDGWGCCSASPGSNSVPLFILMVEYQTAVAREGGGFLELSQCNVSASVHCPERSLVLKWVQFLKAQTMLSGDGLVCVPYCCPLLNFDRSKSWLVL